MECLTSTSFFGVLGIMQKIHQELEDDFVILGVDFEVWIEEGAAFFF